MSSFARILPFVKPIEHLLLDPTVTEVMVNAGGRRVFVERSGMVEEVPDLALDERNLKVAIKNIARTCGDEISDVQPILDARLEDGSRVAAMFPPCSVILGYLKKEHAYGNKVTGKQLADYFGGPGYAWDLEVVRLVLAVLFRAGAVEVTHQARRYRNFQEPQARPPFTQVPAFRSASFAPRESIELKTLTTAVKKVGE